MTTITINERTKAGKIVLQLARMLSASNKGVTIDSQIGNDFSLSDDGISYNPKFVAMVKKAQKSKKRTIIDPNDVWGSLGLK